MASRQFIAILALLLCTQLVRCRYDPNWNSLDTRPLPQWYDDAKFGIFITWGVFSVPSFGSEWFWYYWSQGDPHYVEFMNRSYPPGMTYADFASRLHAGLFDADEWASLIKRAGARYAVLVSKFHDGFALWPSKYAFNWNAMDVGPKRDLVGELSTAVRKTGIRFGMYHSLFEWFHPLYLEDKANGFQTQVFVRNKVMPEMVEMVEKYRPEVIWSDGDWEATDAYWNSTQFLAWLYNESPVRDSVVVNDRWGSNTECKHGDVWDCSDRFNPGHVLPHKWENVMTPDRASWGFRREAVLDDYLSIEELIAELVSTVSCGGNLLLNMAPTRSGRIPVIYEERLTQIGQWLAVNGEAIYETRPWKVQNDSVTAGVWYTANDASVFIMSLTWTEQLVLGSLQPKPADRIVLLAYPGVPIPWKQAATVGIVLDLTTIPHHKLLVQWAYAFKVIPSRHMRVV